jgi:LacI family transcriptional regulator
VNEPATEPPPQPTLLDVAREAGVSLATASRVLNGSDRQVGERYAEPVERAARALGYTANLAAQAMARGATQSVALVVADIADPYFSSISAGVVDAASRYGLLVTLAITGRDPAREVELIRLLRGQRPRAIIVVGSRMADDEPHRDMVVELRRFEQSGGRVTLVSQPGLPFPTVEIDNVGGAAALAGALVSCGFRDMAVLTGPPTIRTARDRVNGFLGELAAHGISVPDHLLVPGEFTRDGGFVAAGELDRRGLAGVELVFAVNDVMAVGAMAYLRATGRRLPSDLAVAGFDDIPTLRDIVPALTTVALPLERIGRLALECAVEPHGGQPVEPVQGHVMIRESTSSDRPPVRSRAPHAPSSDRGHAR